MYKCIPWYYIQLQSQCTKQSMNHFSSTQRSLTKMVTMTCDEPPSPTNCHPILFFKIPTPFQKPNAVCRCGCLLREFSWVCWRRLRRRRIWYLSSWGRLILSYWQNDQKNPTYVGGEIIYQAIHHSSCLSHIIYLPIFL